MTDEEIMKFAYSITNGYDSTAQSIGRIQGARWARDNMLQKRDEYAEEYAKAMIEWLRKTQFAGELTIETADKFK